jgi:hypothetical protein
MLLKKYISTLVEGLDCGLLNKSDELFIRVGNDVYRMENTVGVTIMGKEHQRLVYVEAGAVVGKVHENQPGKIDELEAKTK